MSHPGRAIAQVGTLRIRPNTLIPFAVFLIAVLALAGCGESDQEGGLDTAPVETVTQEGTTTVEDELKATTESQPAPPKQTLRAAKRNLLDEGTGRTSTSSQDFDGHSWATTEFDIDSSYIGSEFHSFQATNGTMRTSTSPSGAFIGWEHRGGSCWVELTDFERSSVNVPFSVELLLSARLGNRPTDDPRWVSIEVPAASALEVAITGLSDIVDIDAVEDLYTPAELLVVDGLPERIDIDIDALGQVLDEYGLDAAKARQRAVLMGNDLPELTDPDRFQFFTGTVMVDFSRLGNPVEDIVPRAEQSIPFAPILEKLTWPEICRLIRVTHSNSIRSRA